MRAKALLNADIDRRVVVGEHGFGGKRPPEANASGYDPFSPQGSNYNLDRRSDRTRSHQRHHGASIWSLRSLLHRVKGAAEIRTVFLRAS